MTKVAVVGGGVIGKGWAALLLALGHEVWICDPNVRHDDVVDFVENVTPALRDAMGEEELDAGPGRLVTTTDLRAAVQGAGWVQENGPESEAVKAELLAEIDLLCPPETIIASSTSGTSVPTLASWCPRHPERVLVGHPFNPVYLIPLIEVVTGPTTSPEVIDRALAFYTDLGKRPIHLRADVPGHVANRLQAALWQEAYSLVERGIATVADIDAAISHGPGLRWSLLGPLVNQHLSGGPGGLGHVLDHLGPPAEQWMADLRPVQMNDDLKRRLVYGVEDELADIDQAALVAERDRLLVQLIRLKSDGNLPR